MTRETAAVLTVVAYAILLFVVAVKIAPRCKPDTPSITIGGMLAQGCK